jgi:hypothetical protein
MKVDWKLSGNALHLSPLAGRGRIASAIRVRGSVLQGACNFFKHPEQIARNIVVPKPQDTIVTISEPCVSDGVALTIRMLPAINFHDQSAFAANKVDDIRSDRFLPDEFVAIQPARSKAVPEYPFSAGRSASQSPRAISLKFIGAAHAETPPHPSRFARRPLPASGERRNSTIA